MSAVQKLMSVFWKFKSLVSLTLAKFKSFSHVGKIQVFGFSHVGDGHVNLMMDGFSQAFGSIVVESV